MKTRGAVTLPILLVFSAWLISSRRRDMPDIPSDLRDSVSDGAFSFDSEPGSMAETVRELKENSGSQKTPVVSTGTPISSELAHFWEDLRRDTVDSLCKRAEIKLNREGRLADVAGLDSGFRRYLRRFPNENLALIDEVNVKLSASLGSDVLRLPDLGGLNVNISGVLEGKSQVVQPLENRRQCEELGTLFKFYQVRTALPARAGRIATMKNGEIWKLPLTLRLSFGSGIGAAMNEALNVSISAGRSREHKPSVTLYRMDDNTLRLRLRLDRVEVRSAGASASSLEMPVSALGLIDAENILAREINRSWAREINKYMAFRFSYALSRFSGRKLLLEFLLDPHNPEQMAGLEKFLQGDFGIAKRFMEMQVRFNQFSEDAEGASGLGDLADLAGQTGQTLNSDPSFAGSNIYHGHTSNLNIQAPVIHTHENSWSSSYNRYQSLANGGETLHVHQQTRVSNGNSMNVPFLGTMVKYDSQKNVYVVNREATGGRATRPMLMYQQNEGFVRQGDGAARYMLERANGMLRYVGMNGNGVNTLNVLPDTDIFPPEAIDSTDPLHPPSKVYESAVMSFKLLINERGVQGIIFAPARAIMKAYMNMMRETHADIIDKISDLFTVNKIGKVDCDWKAAGKRLGGGLPLETGANPLDIVRTLTYTATRLIRDMVSVREAATWKEQSGKLSEVAAGRSGSGLKYEDFFKVALQLTSPEDVSAEVYIHTDKRVKGEADVTRSYRYFNSRESFDYGMAEINQVRERFAEPSELTD